MPTLNERVIVLENRVDDLEELSRRNARDVAGALAAYHQNTNLLNALRVTQAEHSRKLDEHTATLGRLVVGVHAIETMLGRFIEMHGSADDN